MTPLKISPRLNQHGKLRLDITARGTTQPIWITPEQARQAADAIVRVLGERG